MRSRRTARRRRVAGRTRRRARRPARSQRGRSRLGRRRRERGGPAQVPARHHVGERVVVDRLVVLVRADHAVDVRAPVRVDADARGPVARGLDEQLAARRPSANAVVAGPVEVAATPPTRRRRRCAPRARRFGSRRPRPVAVGADAGVTSTPSPADSQGKRAPSRPSRRAACARRRQPADPVLEHRARGGGMGRGEERQHEDVAVPEDVAAVGGPAEPAGADRRLAAVGDRRHQVEEREADRPLQLRVALDDDVGALPAPRPGLAVLGEQPPRSPPSPRPRSAALTTSSSGS